MTALNLSADARAVRVHAFDLQDATRQADKIRAASAGQDNPPPILLDIEVLIDRNVGSAFAALDRLPEPAPGAPKPLRYIGTPRGLAGLISDVQRLGIADIARRRADRISHGQAQRLAVARALVNRPAVVLADEPTSALDDAHAAGMLALLRETAAAEGAGLVIATHDRRVIDAVDATVSITGVA